MLELFGKIIPITLKELIAPVHAAIVVVDAQNEFCKEGGAAYKSGGDLSKFPETIKNIKKVIEEARKVGVLVVYTQNTGLPNHASDSADFIRYRYRRWAHGDPEKIPAITVEGSWGQKIVNEIKPAAGDVVIKKNRSSGFIQSNMDLVLRNHGIRTLIITGFVSHGCVLATAIVGSCLDYFIVLARDCVNTGRRGLNEPAIQVMEWRYDVVTSNQIIEIWKNNTQKS